MGVLLSAFLWPYAFTLLLAGGLVDRLKPRRVLTISMIVWSIAQGAAGFIVSYGQFLLVRALLGVGEAPMFPTAARVVNDWYHESDQALGVGIWNGAPSLGTAIAPTLLTPVMLVFGWRWMFVLMAVLGLASPASGMRCIAISMAKHSPRWTGIICIDGGKRSRGASGACRRLGQAVQLPQRPGG